MHALLDGGGRGEASVAGQVVHVCKRRGDVAGLEGQETLLCLCAQGVLEDLDEVEEFHGVVVADVVEAVRDFRRARVGVVAGPGRVGDGGAVEDADDALDDVVDVGEVALHAAVVEDVDGLAGQDGPGEEEEGHVRTAPGTVDGEEAQARARNSIEMGVGMGHEFVGLLAGGVEGDGVVDVVVDGEGHEGVGAVDRGGGGKDEVADGVVAAALEDIEEAGDVAVDVGVGVDEGVADAGLGGQVDDGAETVFGEEVGHAASIGKVEADEGEAGAALELGEAGVFEGGVVVVVEVVEADDGVAAVEQAGSGVEADEAGGAGDQDGGAGGGRVVRRAGHGRSRGRWVPAK